MKVIILINVTIPALTRLTFNIIIMNLDLNDISIITNQEDLMSKLSYYIVLNMFSSPPSAAAQEYPTPF